MLPHFLHNKASDGYNIAVLPLIGPSVFSAHLLQYFDESNFFLWCELTLLFDLKKNKELNRS